jgi:aminocarboxymuconate-semialdehyde decarboxylase
MESERQSSYPGKLLDLAVEEGVISAQQQEEVWSDNVIRWLCGEEQEQFMERITKGK